MFVALAAPVRSQLRKSHSSSAYEEIFDMEFLDLICRFAALDGTIDASEGEVFLHIFETLHPKSYAGFSAAEAATLLDGHFHRHSEKFQSPVRTPLLLSMVRREDKLLAATLGELMYNVAVQVAVADGPLSSPEQAELEALRTATSLASLAVNATQSPTSADSEVGYERDLSTSDLVEPFASQPEKESERARSEAAGPEGQSHNRVSAPSPSTASFSVPFERLLQTTADFVVELERLLKVELRKTRQVSVARDLLEQDLRAVIVRFGFVGGSISEDASTVYLQLFKRFHPKTYAGWTVDGTATFLQRLAENNSDTYLGPLKKPYTLGFVESFDAAHGTNFVKPTCDLVLAIAVASAAVNGVMSDGKTAEVARLKAVLGSRQ
jgi:tellurite resistance protein